MRNASPLPSETILTHSLLLIFVTLLIFALGLLMVFGTSSADVLDRDLNQSQYQALLRHLAHGTIGLFLGLGIWMMGYKNILRLTPLLLVLCVILLALVFIPGIGRTVNGSRRWISIAGVTLQPSEFAKIVCPFVIVYIVQRYPETKQNLKLFLKRISVLALPLFLIFLEPDNGTCAITACLILSAFLMTRIKWKYWALPCIVFALIVIPVAYNLPYVRSRLQVYLNPEKDLLGKGHQPYQAKIAAGSGRIFGRGIGQSLQKMTYLPEAQNDYIAAIFAEELGFLGILLLLFLYMMLIYIGFLIAYCSVDRIGLQIAVLVTFVICFQAFLNLAVVSGMLPSTGVNLPLFSQGGTSLIVNFIAIACLLSVAKESVKKNKKQNRLFYKIDTGRDV